ncbi:MAG: hypothetical protein HY329_25730 [Chloroflexi bacterium]|nr:hypothetical protein [Chloroflexota bacterium]
MRKSRLQSVALPVALVATTLVAGPATVNLVGSRVNGGWIGTEVAAPDAHRDAALTAPFSGSSRGSDQHGGTAAGSRAAVDDAAAPSPEPPAAPSENSVAPPADQQPGARSGDQRKAGRAPMSRVAPAPQPVTATLPRYAFLTQPKLNPGQTTKILVALHGMGSSGPEIATTMKACAERNNWLLVAPTFDYANWRDPEVIKREIITLHRKLKRLVDEAPERAGVPAERRVLVFGFSRGAQLAHRFAYIYPETVERVAIMGAGTYTLPLEQVTIDGDQRAAVLPYGVADLTEHYGRPVNPEQLREVQFQVAVGAQDNSPDGIPRSWDPYLGVTRVERAQRFTASLQSLGVPAQLKVIPNTGHEVNAAAQSAACTFFSARE